MKATRFLAGAMASAMTMAAVMTPVSGIPALAAYEDATKYTYEIIPLMEPFNNMFFVKTENPDPESFQFADRDTKYSEGSGCITASSTRYADVDYDSEDSLRVNGGYIFTGSLTDGGDVTLQQKVRSYTFEDTDIIVKAPEVMDNCDYLIKTYADENAEFFDNMTAVQQGFSSICFYSGSNIRGELVRYDDTYWGFTGYNHVDQSFYIYSPYARKDTRYLLASSVYPFRYDSLGFPGMMGSVAKRLSNNKASYETSEGEHAFIDVTYNGVTKVYGGQGNGEGQAVLNSDIIRRFSFDSAQKPFELTEMQQLLKDYMDVKVESDIPTEDMLTWKQITDKAGYDGMWARACNGYAYIYKADDDDYFYDDEFGAGNRLYWWGSMGYASDAWIDGRYVGQHEVYIPGATFEEHPTSDIIVINGTLPILKSWKTKTTTDENGKTVYEFYDPVFEYENKNICYSYDKNKDAWYAEYSTTTIFPYNMNKLQIVQNMADKGIIDEAIMKQIKLTHADVEAMNVDRNTDLEPQYGYIYDQTVEPGTPFGNFPAVKPLGVSVSLRDSIDAYFTFEVTGENVSPYSIKVNFTGDDGTVYANYDYFNISRLGNNRYKALCSLPAKNMTTNITMTLTYNETDSDGTSVAKTTDLLTYSIADYVKDVAAAGYNDDKTADLLKAMLNYGAYSQKYFGYNTSALANKGNEIDLVPATDAKDTSVVDIAAKGITYAGSSLMLKSKTAIRHYFKLDEGVSPEDFTFNCDNQALKLVKKADSDYYYIEIKNIYPTKLDKDFVLSINGKDSITYSVEDYIAKVMAGKDTDLKNTVSALWMYGKASKAFAG